MTHFEFSTQLEKWSGYLNSFAIKLTKDTNDAEDLYQETAYKAYKNRNQWKPGTNFKAWMSTIMKNTFINSFRRKKRAPFTHDYTETQYLLNNSVIDPSRSDSNIIESELWNIVHSLPPMIRDPFLMYYQGFKYEEIALQESLALGTVKSRIHKARKEMKKRIISLQV